MEFVFIPLIRSSKCQQRGVSKESHFSLHLCTVVQIAITDKDFISYFCRLANYSVHWTWLDNGVACWDANHKHCIFFGQINNSWGESLFLCHGMWLTSHDIFLAYGFHDQRWAHSALRHTSIFTDRCRGKQFPLKFLIKKTRCISLTSQIIQYQKAFQWWNVSNARSPWEIKWQQWETNARQRSGSFVCQWKWRYYSALREVTLGALLKRNHVKRDTQSASLCSVYFSTQTGKFLRC